MHDECRLIAFAAVRNGSEIRRVGFDQEPVRGHRRRQSAQRVRVTKRHNPAEADVESESQQLVRELTRAGEAVQHAQSFAPAGVPRVGRQFRNRLAIRRTAMNNDWQIEFCGKPQLGSE